LHHQHLRYGVYDRQHEAGYDAFLTAQVFLALAGVMVETDNVRINDTTGDGLRFYFPLIVDEMREKEAEKGEKSGSVLFKGGVFEECEGKLSINGTIEGVIKLEKEKQVVLEKGKGTEIPSEGPTG
jgi:DNA polymerase III epsilon subunit-like protein